MGSTSSFFLACESRVNQAVAQASPINALHLTSIWLAVSGRMNSISWSVHVWYQRSMSVMYDIVPELAHREGVDRFVQQRQ